MKLYLSNRNNWVFFSYLKIFKEADIDENNEISIDEFEHVVSKSPDFAS
jgi:hypothetical protein